MSEDLWVRCTGCGSVLTAPAFVEYMWKCRMCHSVFPVEKMHKRELLDQGVQVVHQKTLVYN